MQGAPEYFVPLPGRSRFGGFTPHRRLFDLGSLKEEEILHADLCSKCEIEHDRYPFSQKENVRVSLCGEFRGLLSRFRNKIIPKTQHQKRRF